MSPFQGKSIICPVEPRSLRLLEFDKIQARLDAHCASSLGRDIVARLGPTSDGRKVREALAQSSQARAFLEMGKNAPFGGIVDITEHLAKARIGSVLDAEPLLQVANFARGSRRLKESIATTEAASLQFLHGHARLIVPHAEVEDAVLDAIDANTNEVKDEASLRLRKARRNTRQTESDIKTKLRQMLTDPNIQPLLQDVFVTVRDNRYCLPVKSDCRGRFPGIVHDRSASGGAFFIEPQAVVEMNNRLRELAMEERAAILEVLRELTAKVAAAASDLAAALGACAQLDFAFAKARLSLQMQGVEPVIADPAERGGYLLKGARHPLVENCVANDIVLGDGSAIATGEDYDVMLITGPNTGGKTVVLKTLGLLTCMAACGLHLPVESGSWLAIPRAVFADIGDEQSIEQSLSTFSSHLKQIIHILSKAQRGDLILLDEIGAGTDPDEGAALAKAVLRALQRRGARVVATSHYGELKQFALGSERFVNASVEFDTASLRPTYHLRIGVPGASNALDIAARLGMPQELVQRARRYLGRDRESADAAVQRLEETQRELEQQTVDTRRERDEIAKIRKEYEKKLHQVQAQADAQLAQAQLEAGETVERTRAESDAILKELRGAGRESKQTEEARKRLKTLHERVTMEQKNQVERLVASRRPKTPEPEPEEPLDLSQFPFVGDMVKVRSLNREGILLSAPGEDGRVSVRVGALKVQLSARDIEAVAQSRPTVGGVAAIRLRKAVSVPEEMNFIGKTVDETMPDLEKYIDDALLADVDRVRIVHGRGSGALRTAIHKWLKTQNAVREFHLAPMNEGGEGATIAELK